MAIGKYALALSDYEYVKEDYVRDTSNKCFFFCLGEKSLSK